MARAVDYQALSDATMPRIKQLVENSLPDPDRPPLSKEVEQRLEPVERKTAATYADMEEGTHRIHRLARKIRRK